MTLRDLTPDELAALQTKCLEEYKEYKHVHMIPNAYDTIAKKVWLQAYSNGLKAYLTIQS